MSFSPSIPLTFGVELEGIFAFHHDKLEEHLQAHLPSATIIKTLDSDQRKALRQKAYPDQLYQSWAMANAGENSMTASASVLHEAGFIRAYKDEPLHVAKNLFSATKVGKDIVLHNPENHSKPEEYKSWILTSDHSIVSLENSEKITAFPSKIPSSKVDKWDTYGIELVSPPYLSTELCSAQEDISSLFSALQSPSSSAITINETCGLHVHVDLASDECLPIKAIQHLAFLCIIYEDEISRLHLGHRRQRRTEIESNRINFVSEYPSPGDTISRTVIDEETGSEVVKKFAVQFSMKLTRRLIL